MSADCSWLFGLPQAVLLRCCGLRPVVHAGPRQCCRGSCTPGLCIVRSSECWCAHKLTSVLNVRPVMCCYLHWMSAPAAHLAAKGQCVEFIWDEGGIIYADGVPPLTRLPVALVATAEKFYQVGRPAAECRGPQPCMCFVLLQHHSHAVHWASAQPASLVLAVLQYFEPWSAVPCRQRATSPPVQEGPAAAPAPHPSCCCCVLSWCRLQSVNVTLHSSGGHSSMPPIDGSSIGARLASFLSSLTASPPTPRLVSPTRELVEGLLQLGGPWLALLARLVKVGQGD